MTSFKFNQLLNQAGSGLRRSILIGCSLGLLGLTPSAQAQTPAATVAAPLAAKKTITVNLTQQKILLENGVERSVDASSVRPGDVIEYKATYTNNSTKPVKGLQGDLPIPEGLEYLPNSAQPGAPVVKLATKDGVYGVEPLMHQVGGKMVPVAYSEYHALRWNLGQLAPGAVVVVRARAKVETVIAPAASPVQP